MWKEFNKFDGDYFGKTITPVGDSTVYGDTELDVHNVQGQIQVITRVLTAMTVTTSIQIVYERSADGATGWEVVHTSDAILTAAVAALAVKDVIDTYNIPSDKSTSLRYWRVGIISLGASATGTVESFATYSAS
jgi:hypothetical protein